MTTVPVAPVATPISDPFAGKTDEQLAAEVWAGKYGSGQARKDALGDRYAAVQAIVNNSIRRNANVTSTGGSASTEGSTTPIADTATPQNSSESSIPNGTERPFISYRG